MRSRFNPYTLYLAGFVLAIGQSLYFYPHLPDPMASHFGPSGEADGWMSKDSFFWFYGILLLVTSGMLGGIGLWLTKVPHEMINLPNKNYWLAPERREETLAVLQERMSRFGAATMALLIATMELVFEANLMTHPRLDNRTPLLLAAYLMYTVFWTGGLLVRFGKKEED